MTSVKTKVKPPRKFYKTVVKVTVFTEDTPFSAKTKYDRFDFIQEGFYDDSINSYEILQEKEIPLEKMKLLSNNGHLACEQFGLYKENG